MELTKKQVNITKGVAILFMLLLHLFCTKEYVGLFTPLIMIGDTPLIYYLALFGDMCVAIYCFCSGYGLMVGYKNNKENYFRKNMIRILKVIYKLLDNTIFICSSARSYYRQSRCISR